MIKNRNFLIITLIIFLLLSGLGLLIVTNTSAQTSTDPSNINIWLKYVNSKAGYEVAYPRDWKLSIGRSNGYPLFSIFDTILQSQKPNTIEIEQGAKIEINVIDYDISDAPVNYLINDKAVEHVIKSPMSIMSNGVSAAEESVIFDNIQSNRVVLSKNGKTYDIYLLIPNPDKIDQNKLDEYISIFNELVASFQVK